MFAGSLVFESQTDALKFMKTRLLCFLSCLLLPICFVTGAHAATYLESGGKVVIEAESAGPATGWSKENKVKGAKGGAYLVWTGANYFSRANAGRGTLRYTFRVKQPGNYELRWRSYIAEGNNATEANDSWVRFPTGRNISGQHALNGWTKVFMNQLNMWSWSAKTVDNVGKPLRQFFSAGDHIIEVSGRSHGHAIDRLVMYRYDTIKYSQNTFESFAVSSTVGGNQAPTPPAPEPPVSPEPNPPAPTANCEANGSNLGTAIQAYAASCPGIPRKDCDPTANGWVCSSGLIGSNSPVAKNPPTQQPPTVTPTPVQPPTPQSPTPQSPGPQSPTQGGSCLANGANLSAAIKAYAASCPGIARKDCDPSAKGWTCSSNVIGANGPGISNPSNPKPTLPEPPTAKPPVAEPPKPELPVPSGNCEATGSNLGSAIEAYAASCPGIPRKDCDPVGNGWVCSAGVMGNNGPGTSGTGTSNPPSPKPATEQPPTPEQPTPPNPNGSIGKVGPNDLVALHYDNCPDRDDGHALPSGKAVVERSGLSNVIVVNGTCGDQNRNSYQRGSEAVVRAVWGSQWLDYYNQAQASVQTATSRWAQVLANGGDVWVAEGGPSDFTASVLQSLDRLYPSLNLKKIHVVQHAAGTGFNEANSARIGVVKRLADYRVIPNGNISGNGSANFNQKSTFFVGVARQSKYASEWNAAFNYLDPNRRLDFSDTVELLYLINDTSTKNVDDFARNYLR